ncbi:MAG: AI-2E family transporter [Rickettsiales bacterium]|nr:AI-2E family transporter [Rickettsiales bacterium]
MKLQEKAAFTGVILFAFIWLLYLSKAILTPFIFSIVIAYFLNPVVNSFCKKNKSSRLRATLLILASFFAIIISLSMILLPTIYAQIMSLVNALPEYVKIFTTSFYPKISELVTNAGFKMNRDLAALATDQGIATKVFNFSTEIINNTISSTIVIVNVLSLFFITPFIIFYLLRDWDLVVAKVNSYLPNSSSSVVRKIFRDIDETLSGYVRGQINVCLILGAIYSVLLSCTGLNFGFVIGFFTGMLAFIPYVGMLTGFVTAVVVSLFQWGFDIYSILLVISVFVFGQAVEANFLTPNLIGSRIGVHPVWMIFGLFFFGDLLGFIGVLVAVPLTAICAVVVKQLAVEYRKRFIS